MTLDLLEAAVAFGQELQDLLDGVLPVPSMARPNDRRVQVRAVRDQNRYSIRVAEPLNMITLTKNGLPVALLRIAYQCVPDSSNSFLAVGRSDFELRSTRDRSPLVRLDFLRDAHKVPAAHWNIHAERGTVSHLLASTNPDHQGQFSALHFPVGGARMRPCLEDFFSS